MSTLIQRTRDSRRSRSPFPFGRGISSGGGGNPAGAALSAPNAGTPTSSGTTNATVITDQSPGTLYWAVVTNAGSATNAQIVAGSGGNIVVAGSQAIISLGTQTIASITGLASVTTYQIKFLEQNSGGSFSAQASVTLITV